MNEDRLENDRTLTKNSIKSFILRVDLIEDKEIKIIKIAESISKFFDRTEKRQIKKFSINFTTGNSEKIVDDSFDIVLTSEKDSLSITFSELNNAFWIQSTRYLNNSIYKDQIKRIIDTAMSINKEIESKRIGLRYINEFTCNSVKNINKIYSKRLSSVLKFMTSQENQSRVIGMEEYNDGEYKLRLQYGVPNKFYPSTITIFDLLLDIDSYTESAHGIQEWHEVISKLNHAAYDRFIKEINEKLLEEIR